MPMPGRYDILIYRGDACNLTLTLVDGAGVPLDTTTTTYVAQWRTTPDAVAKEDFVTVVLEPGVIRLTLSGTQTTRMASDGYWDLEQRVPLADPRTLLAGSVTITPDVTHA
jgi:hypothetical protein